MEFLDGEKITPEEYECYVSRCGDRITRAGACVTAPASCAAYLINNRLKVADAGVCLDGKALKPEEVRRYRARLKDRLARMCAHGITPDTDLAASTTVEEIEKIDKILAR